MPEGGIIFIALLRPCAINFHRIKQTYPFFHFQIKIYLTP